VSSTKPPSTRRSPRAFSVNKQSEKPAGSDQSTSSNHASAASAKAGQTKRKPRSFQTTSEFRETPDAAAQRLHDQTHAAAQLADELETPPATAAAAATASKTVRRRSSWSRLFWGTLLGLVSLGVGLSIEQLITDLFERHGWLGWLGLGLTGLLCMAILGLALREFWGLVRMAKITRLRTTADSARRGNDMRAARKLTSELCALYANRPDTAQGRGALRQLEQDIIDGSDLIDLTERNLMRPMDKQARTLVMASAKRVSVVTAISPRALIDIGYVLYENIKLIRRIADLYGGRPGTLGFWRLARSVVAHLAVTGSIAIGEGFIQQVVGHGVAAKLSSRLGEGVINGMLTARVGIAAVDLCRPLPFSDQSRPTLSDFVGELIRPEKPPATASGPAP
jgi:putative membrane protein